MLWTSMIGSLAGPWIPTLTPLPTRTLAPTIVIPGMTVIAFSLSNRIPFDPLQRDHTACGVAEDTRSRSSIHAIRPLPHHNVAVGFSIVPFSRPLSLLCPPLSCHGGGATLVDPEGTHVLHSRSRFSHNAVGGSPFIFLVPPPLCPPPPQVLFRSSFNPEVGLFVNISSPYRPFGGLRGSYQESSLKEMHTTRFEPNQGEQSLIFPPVSVARP